MNELITIVVPVYNVDQYLDKCVNSIVNQTYTNLEIILIDDGSTDNSGKLCDEWEKRDYRIQVIHQENSGLSEARNVGIENSNGNYIAFVDSDDFVKNDMYEILLKNLKEYNADVSFCSSFAFSDENEICKFQQGEEVIEYYEQNDVFKQLFSNRIGDLVVAWNKLYAKKVFKNNLKFPKGKIHEDVFFVHRMLGNVNSIIYTNRALYYYRMRQGSLSNTFNIKKLDEIEGMYDRMIFFKQERFKNTPYPLMSFLAYNDKLIRYYCCLKSYNKKNIYDSHIKQIKEKFDVNYDKLMQKSVHRKKRIKYMFFKNFPNIFYFFNKNRFNV